MISDNEIQALLSKQLGKIGAMSGAIGEVVAEALKKSTGRPAFPGAPNAAIGGKHGAEWAAKQLPVQEYRATHKITGEMEQIYKDVLSFVVHSPEFIELIEIEDEPQVPVITAMVGSGIAKMNPTVLCVAFAYDGESANIEVIACAKEGLIKQRSAKKAVDRVMDKLVNYKPPV